MHAAACALLDGSAAPRCYPAAKPSRHIQLLCRAGYSVASCWPSHQALCFRLAAMAHRRPLNYIKAYALASSFFLRPGPALRRRIERTLADAFKGDEPRPEDTLGMPLRGSDKCGLESTCPSFASHMAAAERIRAAHPHVSTILLTSDDVTYLKEWPNYSPRWRFVLNKDDVHQATGGLRKEQANLIGHTKRDIFASMLGTLQLQLRAVLARQLQVRMASAYCRARADRKVRRRRRGARCPMQRIKGIAHEGWGADDGVCAGAMTCVASCVVCGWSRYPAGRGNQLPEKEGGRANQRPWYARTARRILSAAASASLRGRSTTAAKASHVALEVGCDAAGRILRGAAGRC